MENLILSSTLLMLEFDRTNEAAANAPDSAAAATAESNDATATATSYPTPNGATAAAASDAADASIGGAETKVLHAASTASNSAEYSSPADDQTNICIEPSEPSTTTNSSATTAATSSNEPI